MIALINGAISGINKIAIDIPDWIPGVGGKRLGFSIPNIPLLASGGTLLSGMAVVAEAGPELLMQQGNRTRVLPLSPGSANNPLGNVSLSEDTLMRLARLIVQALLDAGIDNISLIMDGREFGRLVRGVT